MKELKGKLLKINDLKMPYERHLYLAAIIATALKEHNIIPIVVGGSAVEFYTVGSYRTGDLDLVSPGYEIIDSVLKALGFQKEKGWRHWFHPDIDEIVEVPDPVLDGSLEMVAKVEIEGMVVHLIGIEDLIIDRLKAYKFWNSTEDGDIAKILIKNKYSELDWGYLKQRANIDENQVEDVLEEAKREVDELME